MRLRWLRRTIRTAHTHQCITQQAHVPGIQETTKNSSCGPTLLSGIYLSHPHFNTQNVRNTTSQCSISCGQNKISRILTLFAFKCHTGGNSGEDQVDHEKAGKHTQERLAKNSSQSETNRSSCRRQRLIRCIHLMAVEDELISLSLYFNAF